MNKSNNAGLDQVRREVAKAIGRHPSEVLVQTRKKNVVRLRHLTVYVLISMTDCTLKEAAHAVGNDSPATASHSYQLIADTLGGDCHERLFMLASDGRVKDYARLVADLLGQKNYPVSRLGQRYCQGVSSS